MQLYYIHLLGIDYTPVQYAFLVVLAVVVSIGTVGVPGTATITATALFAAAGLPVEASAASGHLTVTPDTLVSDLRADPTFAASGGVDWQSAVDSPDTPEAGTTLSDYVGANMAQDSADA